MQYTFISSFEELAKVYSFQYRTTRYGDSPGMVELAGGSGWAEASYALGNSLLFVS